MLLCGNDNRNVGITVGICAKYPVRPDQLLGSLAPKVRRAGESSQFQLAFPLPSYLLLTRLNPSIPPHRIKYFSAWIGTK